MLMVWAVFLVGPNMIMPLHHRRPITWSTEQKCEAEIAELLSSRRIIISSPEYKLLCLEIPDMSGEPA